MSKKATLNYTPPPTVKEFIKDFNPGRMFYDWIVGPVGSGKTTGLFMKLIHLASMQARGPDGIRRTRAVIVRNTAPLLRDTTIVSWNYWFKDGQAGTWRATEKNFTLRFGDIECEVLFRPLDTPDDVNRVLSLEVTFAVIDEFVQIPREIIEALAARCGRYPSAVMGGATNWGMWGSSNPDTEDNWWYEYLHFNLPSNAKFYSQPSGLSEDAENIENLPGKTDYYVDQIKGKSQAWIKQFVECEWGYSAAGKAVVPTFDGRLHIAKGRLHYTKHRPLVIGLDPGLAGSALIFGQEDVNGTLNVVGELIQSGYGITRLINEKLRPYLRLHFPDAEVVIAPDPAAANRSQSDEKSVVDTLKRHFDVRVETNNRLPIRLDAIEHFTTRLVPGGPALQIDPVMCPILIRALKGGWRYVVDQKKDVIKPEPEKNQYSHPGDGFGYLCRYFHRQNEREMRYKGTTSKPFVAPRAPNYHAR